MKKLAGNKGNDIAVRRSTSSAQRQSGFQKNLFADENVANAAKVAIDAFVLAQQK